MKRILFFALMIFFAGSSWAQLPKRMELPALKFSSENQSSLYSLVCKTCAENDAYSFEDEDYADDWAKHPKERMGAAFMVTLMHVQRSLEGVSVRDIAVVAKTFLDDFLAAEGKKVPGAYPFNYKAYKNCVERFLAPVEDRMIGGSQFEMNQYAYANSEKSLFLTILNNFLVESRFKQSNLKAAFEAEEDAWLRLRDCLGDVVYNYKVEINGGIGYSMLPLEVAGVKFRADEVRNQSAGILYAVSREDIGVVAAPMEDEIDDSTLADSFKRIKEEGKGVDITELTENWNRFLSCRNEVEAILPASAKTLYNKDTQRYKMFIANFVQTEY